MPINYEAKLGTRLADFGNEKVYNSANGIIGQCVWYARCRAIEKCGYSTGIVGNANVWYSSAKAKGLKLSTEPVSNSIACFNSGTYGHVIFVECVDSGKVYYTEANSNSDNKLSSDDGILKTQSVGTFKSRSGYQGCIVVGDTTEKSASSAPTFKVGQNYTLLVNVKVRTGAGTSYAQKKRTELTADGQAHALIQTYATLKAGTVVTVQELKNVSSDIWARIPSGWIAMFYGGEAFAKQV